MNQNTHSGSRPPGEAGVFDRLGRRKYLTGAERHAVLMSLNSEPDKASRAFGLTLLHTGCRISEALHLTTQSVDYLQGTLVFETLKRRRKGVFRAVPIPKRLLNLLKTLTSEKSTDERIWSFSRATGYRLIKKHLKAAGIIGVMACPKGFRHGFAVACLSAKIPLPVIRQWLGHARLETTAIYLEVSGEEEKRLASRLWKQERVR